MSAIALILNNTSIFTMNFKEKITLMWTTHYKTGNSKKMFYNE